MPGQSLSRKPAWYWRGDKRQSVTVWERLLSGKTLLLLIRDNQTIAKVDVWLAERVSVSATPLAGAQIPARTALCGRNIVEFGEA